MRSRVLAFWFLSTAVCGLIVGCGSKPASSVDKPGTGTGAGTEPANPNPDIGSLLYTPLALPAYVAPANRREPLVIPNCVVQYDERQIVAAEVEGTIELIATPFKPGEYEKLMADRTLTAEQKADRIVFHPRDPDGKKTPWKRIRESMTVDARQVVALMDDQLVTARIEGALKIKESAVNAKGNAKDGVDAALKKYKQTEKTNGISSGARELLDDQITLSRFLENLDQANTQIAKSEADYKEAVVLLGRHQIKSGVNGVIRTISKRPGAYVKAGEQIMEIEGTDRVRIEGQLDVQYFGRVKIGDKVIVEPALPSAPLDGHQSHRAAVTGVAVGVTYEVATNKIVPLVVSVGADGGALVWEPNLGQEPNRPTVPHNLPHPVGVRSVATTPVAAKTSLVITGADDGKVRLWDVTNRDKLPTAPKTEPADAHTSAVQAIAVSPDGKFFATAAGRDVFVWELATAKKLYALGLEHRDSVASVSFTPQNTLVTASKDNTIKVWKLGTERAAVVRTLDHRAGAIDVLGVSRDGARVLFDQDKGRVDLVDPTNGQTVGQIQNVGTAGSFSTLALFGADLDESKPYTIVTAGGDGDLKGTVQVWQAPRTGGRGSEIGRLITGGRSPVAAAAFSPVRGEPFLVVGTSAGGVHLWKPPSEAAKRNEGYIVNIDATDSRYVTVRVEMDNRELRLIDHSVANVIIP